MTKEQKENAFKELALLQSLIDRQEKNRLQFRNWYIGLLTATTIAFLSKDKFLKNCDFLILGTGLTIIFAFLEVVYGITENRAIDRSLAVENQIRDGENYDGPKIGLSLRPKKFLSLREFKYKIVTVVYFTLWLFIFLLYWFKH